MKRFSLCVGLLLASLFVSLSASAAVTITTDTTILAGDLSLENQDVVVDGATLTLNGSHAPTSLSVINGGVVTHTTSEAGGLSLTTLSLVIDTSSSIDVSARGLTGRFQAQYAGGSHGGKGGFGGFSTNGGLPVEPYGNYLQPIDLGLGGRCQISSQNEYGGGAVKIVAQSLTVEGSILANGDTPFRCAGSAGGSIWLDVGTISGSGFIAADGSPGERDGLDTRYRMGGGGGGRIAIYYDDATGFDFVNQVTALGSDGDIGGPATDGTVLLKQKTSSLFELRLDALDTSEGVTVINSLLSGDLEGSHYQLTAEGGTLLVENDEWTFDNVLWSATQAMDVASLSVLNGSVLFHATSSVDGLEITSSSIVIDGSSSIDVSARGLTGRNEAQYAGGSHGGKGGFGGFSTNGGLPVEPYGNYLQPIDLGLGGRCQISSQNEYGGGAVKIVAQSLTVEGSILANGDTPYRCAGSAGGSIWLDVGTISGSGFIAADGSPGERDGLDTRYRMGGGGGGRIAIYYDDATGFDFVNQVTALGSDGDIGGPATDGTVLLKQKTSSLFELRLDALDTSEGVTVINSLLSGDLEGSHYQLTAEGGTLLVENDEWTFDNVLWSATQAMDVASLSVLNGSVLFHATSSVDGLEITSSSIVIDGSSSIDVSARGLTGRNEAQFAGGSHGGIGGFGGFSSNGGLPVAPYGSDVQPIDLGLGGRCQISSQNEYGGGAVKIVAQSLTVEGSILANGDTPYRCAGSAGGSIWLDVGTLAGSGFITADGSPGERDGLDTRYRMGGGGGGRIAIYYDFLVGFDLNAQISVLGGSGDIGGNGSDGTIHLVDGQRPPVIISADPAEGDLVADVINSVNVSFLAAIDASSFTNLDVQITADVPVAVVSIVEVSEFEYSVVLDQDLPDGNYQFTIGPDIRVAAGFQMDQDQDGVDGEPLDDAFVLSFEVDNSPPALPEITGFDLAPAVNQINDSSISISGNRTEASSIEIDGVERVPYGTGVFTIDTVILVQGDNQVDLVAVDQAGNQSESVSLLFFVDSVPPVISGYTPTGNLSTVPTDVAAFVTEANGLDVASTLTLARNSINIPGSVSVTANSVTFTPGVPLTEGIYTVAGSVQDSAGNTTPLNHTFVLDYTPPAAPVVDSVPAVVNNASLLISGSKEADTAIGLDGNEVVSNNGGTTWNTTVTLAEGDNALSFTAVDLAGNVSEPTLVNVRFDDTAPGPVTLSAPLLDGDGSTLTLRWPTYSEVANGGDIATYRIYRSANSFADVSGLTELTTVSGGSFEVTVTDHPRGSIQHYAAVVAVDQQGLLTVAVTSTPYTPNDTVAPDDISNLNVVPGATTLDLGWSPSTDSDGDLAEYRVYVTTSGNTTSQSIDAASVAGNDPITFQVTGLAAATENTIQVVAVDNDGNESTGQTNPGVTLVPHPTNLQVVAFSGRVDLSWQAVAPVSLVQQYNLYAETSDYSSVAGLMPKRTVSASSVSSGLAALTDGTTYYFAITAVNLSGGEDPVVTTVAATPEEDIDGPIINSVSWIEAGGSVDLDGAVLTRDGHVTLDATDQAGLGRARVIH